LTPDRVVSLTSTGSESTQLPASLQDDSGVQAALNIFDVEGDPMLEAVLPLFSIQIFARAAGSQDRFPLLNIM